MGNRREWQHLERVKSRVLTGLPPGIPVREAHLIPVGADGLEVYVFYHHDDDVRKCCANGASQTIEEMFMAELKRSGRGTEFGENVRFEFDSHENVSRNYKGSYFLRLK